LRKKGIAAITSLFEEVQEGDNSFHMQAVLPLFHRGLKGRGVLPDVPPSFSQRRKTRANGGLREGLAEGEIDRKKKEKGKELM